MREDIIKVWNYFIGTIIKPVKTFRNLSLDPDKTKYVWLLVLICGVLYLPILIAYVVIGMIPWYSSLLKIPAEKYSLYLLITYPFMIIGFIFDFGLIEFGGLLFGSKTPSKPVFVLTWYAVIIPLTLAIPFEGISLIPVLITGAKIHTGFWIGWLVVSYALQIIWMFILLSIAAYVSKDIKIWQAITIGVITNIIHWGLGFTFLFY